MPWTMVASAARWFSSTRHQIADVLEPPVGDVGGDLLHGVEAEVAAVGEDRGEQRAHLPGVDPLLAGLLEVDAEPEVVLDLDEQVGEPDRAAAGVQPAVELGEAVRLRRVGLLGRVRLQPPPGGVERDLPVVSDTLQEAVLQRRRGEVERRMGRNAAASRSRGVRGRPAAPTASATSSRPARRRTSSCSEMARRTGSARRAARPSARSGPCGRPASSSPGRTGPRAAAPRARLTAAGPAARRR